MLLFTLTNNKTKKSYTATSDKYGYLKFTGLDAGEYTLQETDAPDGFTLNDANIQLLSKQNIIRMEL